MKVKLDDPTQIISHFLLQNSEVVDKVIDTKQFKETGTVVATLFMNGVEIPVEVIEETMHDIFKQQYDAVRAKYHACDIDELAQEKAKAILEEKAKGILDKFDEMRYKLEEIDELVIGY